MMIEIENLRSAIAEGRLRQGAWHSNKDGVETVCAMSALVPGATGTADCVDAGWPHWLTDLVTDIFDAAPDVEAGPWSLELAEACLAGPNLAAARHRFILLRLRDGKHSAMASLESVALSIDAALFDRIRSAIAGVADLHERALAGDEPSAAEWNAAADAASWAATSWAATSWPAAEAAARAAAKAASWAATSRAAAAEAAARAAAAEAAAAEAAARAAARADLITALRESAPDAATEEGEE